MNPPVLIAIPVSGHSREVGLSFFPDMDRIRLWNDSVNPQFFFVDRLLENLRVGRFFLAD